MSLAVRAFLLMPLAFAAICANGQSSTPPFFPTSKSTLYNNGNDLAKLLRGGEKEQIYYHGYVIGIADTLASLGSICIPEHSSPRQAGAIVEKYLKNNPEQLHVGGPALIVEALKKPFSCETNK